MYHFPQFHPSVTLLLAWLYEHSNALLNASTLLGGQSARRRTERVVNDILTDGHFSRRRMNELLWLHGLLTLENVADPDSDEAAFFGAIDPADPVVYEICALADGLGDRLDPLQHNQAQPTHGRKAA